MKRKVTFATAASVAVSACGALAVALLFAPNAQAQCGAYRSPLAHPSALYYQFGQPRLLRAGFATNDGWDDTSAAIVGFWHVKFISDGVSSGIPGGVPKGAEVDAGFAQWHSDGTEIMNSGGRAPNTSSFCLSVWEKIAPGKYLLIHLAISWDPTQGPVTAGIPAGVMIGPGNIREAVTLAPNGETFIGSFTIDQYDVSGTKLAVHLQGTITGTRVHVTTPVQPIF